MVVKIEFRLKSAEEVRQSVTVEQQKKIKQMYEEVYQSVIKELSKKQGTLQEQNLILLKRDIQNRIKQLNEDIKNNVIRYMNTVSEEVATDKRTFLKQCGFKEQDIQEAFMFVPDEIVKSIVTGNIYQEGWTLSGAIWGYNKKTQDALTNIISIGTAQGKSTYEIAKDLEYYVNPSAKKPSRTITKTRKATQIDVQKGRASYVGEPIQDRFYFGKVDYNAQRLARTMISHAYQQSFQRVNQNDPFITAYQWLTSNFHGRVCNICKERAGTDQYGLGVGVFPKEELPLDHPNGMCTFIAVSPYSMNEIADMIGKWYQSPYGTYPDIDRYALDFVA